jgi:chromosomal replication initiator protein
VTIDALKDKTRKKEVSTARQVAMYFAKEYTDYSLKQIGQYFGGRDHSTVIHAVQCVHNLIDTDLSFKKTVDDLKKQLSSNTPPKKSIKRIISEEDKEELTRLYNETIKENDEESEGE